MGFEFQRQPTTGYTELLAEHRRLYDWLALHPGKGHVDCLDERVIDDSRRIVAYRVRGLGMGSGDRFALVKGEDIVTFNAWTSFTPTERGVVRLSSIEIPESLLRLRDELQALMVEACACYFRSVEKYPPVTRFEVDPQPWRVVPSRYSKLDMLERTRKLRASLHPKLRAAWRALTGPLVSAIALVLLVALSLAQVRIPFLAILLAACWCCWKFWRYDDDLVFGHWLIGRTKAKNPLSAFEAIARSMAPRPLNALKATLTRPCPSRPNRFTLKVLNASWYPASYVSISPRELADLVAPGFCDALRAANNGAISSEALNASFPGLRRRWLLPRQAVEWHVEVPTSIPLGSPARSVTAMVAISRRVSGEVKQGAQSFVVPVEVVES